MHNTDQANPNAIYASSPEYTQAMTRHIVKRQEPVAAPGTRITASLQTRQRPGLDREPFSIEAVSVMGVIE